MKVAYFIGALNHGGAESMLLDICRKWRELPFDMVCLYRKEGNMTEAFRQTEGPLVKVFQSKKSIRDFYQFRKMILNEQIDVVHSQTPFNTLLCGLALIGTSVKIVTTFHGHSFANTSGFYRRFVYKRSQRIVCVSHYQKTLYERRWHLPQQNKFRLVYNGVDFSKIGCQKPFDARNVNSNDICPEINLCMVGNFQGGRSPLVICKAIERLKAENMKFYFIGRRVEAEGWRYDECVEFCNGHGLNNVFFLGGRSDVPQLLHQMDGYVYSTESDTFGISVIEAMAAGLPVVVNDWDVMREICTDGNNKWATFFRSNDVEDCAEKMLDLIQNIDKYKEKARGIALQVCQKYSIEKHIDNLAKVYSEII